MRIITLIIIIFFSTGTTALFAAHCPASSDFIQTEGIIWGHYWDLTPAASQDWYIKDKHIFSATTPVFPNDSSLMVRIEPATREVKCLYILPGTSGLAVLSNSDKKVNLDSIDLTIFIPKHQNNNLDPTQFKHWQDDYSITSLSCEGATAGNPNICYWQWS